MEGDRTRERHGRRSGALAPRAAGLALLVLSSSCGPTVSAQESGLHERFAGTLESPIAGLALSAPPTAYYHGKTVGIDPPFVGVRLADDEDVSVSRNWMRVLRWRAGERSTSLLRDARQVTLTGRMRIALDAAGRTTVVWSEDPRAGPQHLAILGPDEAVRCELDTEQIVWVDVAADGGRLAIGTRKRTLVLDQSCTEVASLAAAARGAFSARGEWLALDALLGDQHRLTLARLDPPESETFDFPDSATGMAFDPSGERAVRVASRALRTFRIDAGGPRLELELPAPAGFSWRSAAFDAQGRLAAGRIRVVRRAKRVRGDPAESEIPGQAQVAVDLFPAGAASPGFQATLDVSHWNARAPELAFDADGRLFCIVWPSVYEGVLP